MTRLMTSHFRPCQGIPTLLCYCCYQWKVFVVAKLKKHTPNESSPALRMSLIFLIWTFFAVYIGIGSINAQLLSSKLYNDLFVTNGYNPDLVPLCENEKDQILTLNVWFRMKWHDCRLKWNASDYDGVSYFHVPYHGIWFPDITSLDSAADEVMYPGKEDFQSAIYNNGEVHYNYPTVLKTVCRMDVTYFPFDTQVCTMAFGSWSHHGFELDLFVTGGATHGDLTYYVEHNEWKMVAFPVVRTVVIYNCCDEPYPEITFYLTIKRKALFHMFTAVFPCICTSSLSALAFILPPASGEKVSVGVTILLALAVFLMMLSEQLPASADHFPIIAMYFAASMTLVGISCSMTVLVLNVHFHGNNGSKVPHWIKFLIVDKLGYLVCTHNNAQRFYRSFAATNQVAPGPGYENGNLHKQDSGGNVDINMDLNDETLQSSEPLYSLQRRQSVMLDKLGRITEQEVEQNDNLTEWHEVAFILDRVFLATFIFVSLLSLIVFLEEITSAS